jgi:hypothetical protein
VKNAMLLGKLRYFRPEVTSEVTRRKPAHAVCEPGPAGVAPASGERTGGAFLPAGTASCGKETPPG